MKAIVVGNGRLPERASLPPSTLDDADLVIAADGGARGARRLGLAPDLIVGDLDSIDVTALRSERERGASVEPHAAEKDASDLELALDRALERGADQIVIVGALGGDRLEHALANVCLLARPRLAARAALVDDRSVVRLADASDGPAGLELHGSVGDYVSLLPWGGDAEEVRTRGLRYPLDGERLVAGRTRGLSNELVGVSASIALGHGRLVVVHTRRTSRPEGRSENQTR